jgi:hypothetical protein
MGDLGNVPPWFSAADGYQDERRQASALRQARSPGEPDILPAATPTQKNACDANFLYSTPEKCFTICLEGRLAPTRGTAAI